MPIAHIPLAAQADNRTASTLKDARLVNAMVESSGNSKQLIRRPGLQALTIVASDGNTIAAGQGQGIFTWNNYLVACFSNKVYTIAGENLSTLLGTLNGSQLPLSFVTTTNDNYLAFHNGSNLYTMLKGTPPTFTGGVGLSGVVDSVTITNGGGYYGYHTTCVVSATGGGTTTNIHSVAHGLVAGQGVQFLATTIPSGMVVGTTYQVVSVDADNFTINTCTHGGVIGVPVVTTTVGTAVQYMASPTVVFSDPFTPSNRAYGTAQIFAQQVSGIIVTTIGTGYLAAPSITFSVPPTGVTATLPWPFPNGRVIPTQVAGSGYIIPPTIYAANGQTFDAYYSYVSFTATANLSITGTVPTVTFVTPGTTVDPLQISGITIGAPPNLTATGTVVMASGIQGPFAAGIAYLDTYCYVMDLNGNVFASHQNNPTVWYSASLQASSDPDAGVALIRHLNYLVCFGQWSTEFFYDAGNDPTLSSPLAVNQSAKLEIGCANGYSVAQAEQTVIWVGQSQTKGRSIYVLDGLSPIKISNRYIDKYLNAASMNNIVTGGVTTSSVRSYCLKISGHTLYVLTLTDINKTFVFDLDEQAWYEWTSQTGDTGTVDSGTESYFSPTAYDSDVEYGAALYVQDDDNGLIYKIDPSYYTDNGNLIYTRSKTSILDSGSTKRKFYRHVEVVGDKTTGTAYIRYSDDDYTTNSTFRAVTLSDKRPQLWQSGASRRRSWEFFCSDATPIRIDSLEVDFDVGEQGQE